MIKKIVLPLALSIAAFSPAHADTIGFVVGTGSWSQETTGNISAGAIPTTTMSSGGDSSTMWAEVEHPVPMLPNVRIAQAPLSASNTSGDSLVLDHTDTTLYYELLDNWVTADVGLTFRSISGSLTAGTSAPINVTVPMIYAKAAVEVPASGFSAGVIMNQISGYTDMSTYVAYEMSFGLGVQVGTRSQNIDLAEGTDVTSAIEASGSFMNLYYHF
ncbi:MAG: TIGR04219 family outer membrane beta-barrel protein [Gammaproteobacteria bacterium]|nr:TIGR04219 family outer membrane beta-barrel protein [Gammaproteobacteria bacterium]